MNVRTKPLAITIDRLGTIGSHNGDDGVNAGGLGGVLTPALAVIFEACMVGLGSSLELQSAVEDAGWEATMA